MSDIMPKIDDQMIGLYAIKKYIQKYHKVEIELTKGDYGNFNIEEIIKKFMDVLPNVKEITLKPLSNTNTFEYYFYHKQDILKEHMETMKKLSREYKIGINIIFPVEANIKLYKDILWKDIKEVLNLMKGYNIRILLENMTYIREEECTALQICKFFGDEQLLTCFNVFHAYQRSIIFLENIDVYLHKYLCNSDRYIYQIHFRKLDETESFHHTLEDIMEDVLLLKPYHIDQKIISIDITEKNKQDKIEEIKEIELLEKIANS